MSSNEIAAFVQSNCLRLQCCYANPLVVIERILGSSTLAGAVAVFLLFADADDNYYYFFYFLALLWSCSAKFDPVEATLAALPLALAPAVAVPPPLLCFSYL